jgi:hypothetical protein
MAYEILGIGPPKPVAAAATIDARNNAAYRHDESAGEGYALHLGVSQLDSQICGIVTFPRLESCYAAVCQVSATGKLGIGLFRFGIVAPIAYVPDFKPIGSFQIMPSLFAVTEAAGPGWGVALAPPVVLQGQEGDTRYILYRITGLAQLVGAQALSVEAQQTTLELLVTSSGYVSCALVAESTSGQPPRAVPAISSS